MRGYRPYKHQMGVEGPSFWREQQERRRQEQKYLRDQPQAEEPTPERQVSMWETMFGRPTEPAVGPAPSTPRESAPRYERRQSPAPKIDPRAIYEVDAIWHFVEQMRPGYGGNPFPIQFLTPPVRNQEEAAGEVINHLMIPLAEYRGLSAAQAWTQVIGPILKGLEQGFDALRPYNIPGFIRFELSPENELVMVYWER